MNGQSLPQTLVDAMACIPAGGWAIGVSGGADSVALLRLVHQIRADIRPHVVHLDHELRGQESTADADFVLRLCEKLNVAHFIARRSDLETRAAVAEANPSANYRLLRLHLFREVIAANDLRGVLLAHHADDQAETILQRLLGHASYRGLAGIRPRARVHGITVVRPLLGVRRQVLRDYLASIDQPWRHDASNDSPRYGRNRARRLLSERPQWSDLLLNLGASCEALGRWTAEQAPSLAKQFPSRRLQEIPDVLAHEAARQWLIAAGAPLRALDATALARLTHLARDAATAPIAQFPGNLRVRRRGGMIFCE